MSDWEEPSMEKPRPVHVYGDNAKLIQDGDIFRAKVTYVEGRKVVKLLYGGMEEEGPQ